MKCTICDGEFPEGKHHPDCYSLDPDWDLKQMKKTFYVVKIQSWYRGNAYRRKICITEGISVSMLKEMLVNYRSYVDMSAYISAQSMLKHKNIRKLNFPSEISENLVLFAINKKYRYIKCAWDIKKGDLMINLYYTTYTIEVKAFSSSGPSSFGPTETWDRIYFIDCHNNHSSMFKIYEIRLSNASEIWKNIKVNKTETYYDQCKKKRRPRICFSDLIKQIPSSKYSVIFDGHIDQL